MMDIEAIYKDTTAFIGNVLRHNGVFYGDVEDETQEVWVKLVSSMDRYQERGMWKAWVGRIAKNQSIDYFHKRKNDCNIEEAYNVGVEPTIEEDIDRKELSDRVRTVAEELPRGQRVAVIGAMDGLTLSEIAEKYDISIGTIDSGRYRGIRKIRGVLR